MNVVYIAYNLLQVISEFASMENKDRSQDSVQCSPTIHLSWWYHVSGEHAYRIIEVLVYIANNGEVAYINTILHC